MKTTLHFSEEGFAALRAHLLPRPLRQEEAAFVCAHGEPGAGALRLVAKDTLLLSHDDFAAQHADYLELGDEARVRVIKAAHSRAASLVEFHSHVGTWPAEFSVSDRLGLEETVPHMWWRLGGRPYVAVVMTQTGFDALVWIDGPTTPQTLDAIVVGTERLVPTNRSIAWWHR